MKETLEQIARIDDLLKEINDYFTNKTRTDEQDNT